MRCSVLQCAAVFLSVSQRVIVRYNALCHSALQVVAACRSVSQHVAVCCSVLQCVVVCHTNVPAQMCAMPHAHVCMRGEKKRVVDVYSMTHSYVT